MYKLMSFSVQKIASKTIYFFFQCFHFDIAQMMINSTAVASNLSQIIIRFRYRFALEFTVLLHKYVLPIRVLIYLCVRNTIAFSS